MDSDQVTYTLSASEWDAHWRDANRWLITVAVACGTTGFLLGFVTGAIVGWLL